MKRIYLLKLITLLALIIGCNNSVFAQTTFSYTGAVQYYTVPSGASNLTVDILGAKGGDAWSGYGTGGGGARVQCIMAVTPGQVLNIYVGDAGVTATGAYLVLAGGWNGGGNSGGIDYPGSGGGASDIRIGGTALSNRVVVAGGGGGGGYSCAGGGNGGAGGGLIGGSGFYCGSSTTTLYCPTGGTQTAGGANGTGMGGSASFGIGSNATASSYSGGGGGGYYGGGAGNSGGSGAGGSSYTDPIIVSGVSHTQGYNTSGAGSVVITPHLPAIGGITSICVGSTTTLTDAVTGGTWTSSSTSVATVGLSTGVVTGMYAGTSIVTYTAGGLSVTTIVNVSAVPAPLTGTTSTCVGGTITLSDATTGGTWSSSNPSVAGIGITTGVVTVGSSGSATITYALGSGCSVTKVITIYPLPTVYTVSGGGSYCSGGTGTHIYLSNSDLGINYDLYMYGVFITRLPGTGSMLDFGAYTSAGMYSVMATNSVTSCISTMSGSATVSISPLPTVYTVSGGGSYCTGGAGLHIYLSGSNTGISYQLFCGPSGVGMPLSGTGTVLDFGAQTYAGPYSVVATNITTGCYNNMSGSATITIGSLPTIYSVTGGGGFCLGGSGVAVGISNSSAGINYQLYLGASKVGSTWAGTGSAISFGLQTIAGVYTVVATDPVSGCSSNMSGSATVTVSSVVTPTISITPSPGDTVCPGTTVYFTPTTLYGGTAPTYVWKVNGITISTGSSFSYVPSNGDIVSADMTSSLPCASPATVSFTLMMTVNYMPTISGSTSVCVGSNSTLTDGTSGGTWSSSNSAIASIATIGGSVGVATGISAGTSILTYLLTTGCYATTTLTVNALPVITATSSTSCGDTYTLTSGGGTLYSWSPSTGLSCTTCAVTTISPLVTTTYIVTGTDANGCVNTNSVTINGDRIFGHITFSSSTPDTLDMKVWLIQFDPTDSSIVALDSTTTCVVDSITYYEFDGVPNGNYLVKAKMIYGSYPGTSGYVPTYGLSSPNWYAAATVSHTGTSDSLHISMVYGTVPAGPGFISGYVYSGAGKGTSGETPAAGMLIYLKDLGNNVLTYTYTDGTGAYSFSNLAFGDYIIYPEEYDYNTISSDFITLNSTSPSATAIDFKEFTISRVITPFVIGAGVKNILPDNRLNVYPNPASGVLNIQWKNQSTGNGHVVITDVVGREVYQSAININAASGQTRINLEGLQDGMYLITIKSDNINYSGQLLIKK